MFNLRMNKKRILLVVSYLTFFLLDIYVGVRAESISRPFLSDVYMNGTELSNSSIRSEYKIALGDIKKIDGEWVSDQERRVLSNTYRRTIELPSTSKLVDIISDTDTYFMNKNGRLLYGCEKMDCGSSNARANYWLGIKLLYGMDQTQYYRVWEVSRENKNYYAVIYGVLRGNRRSYLQIDIIEPVSPVLANEDLSQNELIDIFKQQKYFVFAQENVASAVYEPSQRLVQMVKSALDAFPGVKIAVVGHDYTEGALSEQVKQSKAYADKVREALTAAGFSRDRVVVKGVGSLAPEGKQGRARVTIVLLQNQ